MKKLDNLFKKIKEYNSQIKHNNNEYVSLENGNIAYISSTSFLINNCKL